MRSMIFAAMTAAVAMASLALPAQAAVHYGRHARFAPYGGDARSGGFGTGPYWQGEPTDHHSIWRYGYYQGNDPDQGIRFELMRDGRNYVH
jgi:opacity protein-like surface antigen